MTKNQISDSTKKYVDRKIRNLGIFVSTFVLLITILGFAGFNEWLKIIAKDRVEEFVDTKINGRIDKFDNYLLSVDSMLNNERELINYHNDQINMFLRQYELILPLTVNRENIPEKTEDFSKSIRTRVEKLNFGEGISYNISLLGKEERFEFSIFKKANLLYSVNIPSKYVMKHFEQLQKIGFMSGKLPPQIDTTISIRYEEIFSDVENIVVITNNIAEALFGYDKLYITNITTYKNE